MASRFSQPPLWTAEDLDEASRAAIERFIGERIAEGTEHYEELYVSLDPSVRRLFEVTSDLREVTADVFLQNREIIDVARYVGGPPVSADDLKTIVGDRLGTKHLSEPVAERIASTLTAAMDPLRFPWIERGESPMPDEREAAVRWTTGLLAVERLRTKRRTDSSKKQEEAVAAALQGIGFAQSERPEGNVVMVDAIERGTYTKEIRLAGSKCDVLVRLGDGRLLAIECKVSNSAVNSVKRLLRETGGKVDVWRRALGQQVVPAAVLAGVFKLRNLLDAQNNHGIFLVFEDDLEPLLRFIENCR